MNTAWITIDNGPPTPGRIGTDTEVIVVESRVATKPDPTWEHIDERGHFHAYGKGEELPTLIPRSRHVECDGSCRGVCGGEGYDVTQHFCRICDELIEPERLPDHGPRSLPGRMSWNVEVQAHVANGAEVSIRAEVGDQVLFGAAVATHIDMEADWNGARVTTHLLGISPLGTRKARKAVATS
jgi:hypothetical protein